MVSRVGALAGISVERRETGLSHTTAHMVRECHIQLLDVPCLFVGPLVHHEKIPHHKYMAYGQKGENDQKWGA